MGLTLGSKIPRYVFYHLNAFHCNLHKAFLGPFKIVLMPYPQYVYKMESIYNIFLRYSSNKA